MKQQFVLWRWLESQLFVLQLSTSSVEQLSPGEAAAIPFLPFCLSLLSLRFYFPPWRCFLFYSTQLGLCVASGLVDSAQLCPLAISKDGLPGFMVTPDGNKRGGMCISKKARNHRKHDLRKAPFQGVSIFSDSSQPTSTSSSSSISMLASSMISMVTMCSILLSPNTSTSSCLPPTWWSSSGSSSTWPFVSTWKF